MIFTYIWKCYFKVEDKKLYTRSCMRLYQSEKIHAITLNLKL